MLPISGKRCFISQLACFALLPFWLEKYENRNEYICIYILYTYTYVYVCTHARQIGIETLHTHTYTCVKIQSCLTENAVCIY
jgi:hypothetical protein